MEVSFLQCGTAASQHLLLPHSTTTTFTFACSLKSKIPKHVNKPTRISATRRDIPARDRVIDFGRHKGKMLGALPSTYLKWVSNNLRARDLQEWALLADQVLADPVYRDRIEWEFADKVLNGGGSSSSSSSPLRSDGGAVTELLEISERFGWDNDDKVGWGKIHFGLLGTSKGGRIPRVSEENYGVVVERVRERVGKVFDGGEEGRESRRERRERLRMKRGGIRLGPTEKTIMGLGFGEMGTVEKKGNGKVEDDDGHDDQVRNQDRTVENGSPFPGRQSLLKKVLNSRERFS